MSVMVVVTVQGSCNHVSKFHEVSFLVGCL